MTDRIWIVLLLSMLISEMSPRCLVSSSSISPLSSSSRYFLADVLILVNRILSLPFMVFIIRPLPLSVTTSLLNSAMCFPSYDVIVISCVTEIPPDAKSIPDTWLDIAFLVLIIKLHGTIASSIFSSSSTCPCSSRPVSSARV